MKHHRREIEKIYYTINGNLAHDYKMIFAKKILNTLQSQRFTNWETNRFGEYLSGCGFKDEQITKEDICRDIVKLFRL
jgi:hypothetical protein